MVTLRLSETQYDALLYILIGKYDDLCSEGNYGTANLLSKFIQEIRSQQAKGSTVTTDTPDPTQLQCDMHPSGTGTHHMQNRAGFYFCQYCGKSRREIITPRK